MPDAVPNTRQEFWRAPVQAQREDSVARGMVEVCDRCGTEFVVGARFCHVCGSTRDSLPRRRWTSLLEFQQIKDSLGLSTGSLVAFIAGIACVLAAIAVGFIFSAATLLDWQAVQLWRIEWLLGAAAAFLLGILLKRSIG
ncbi:MAG TPA: hypothetical protein VE994_13545 [Terriglobales bacterium]|nr:hypothetical protein [Terriglobales bacterium]